MLIVSWSQKGCAKGQTLCIITLWGLSEDPSAGGGLHTQYTQTKSRRDRVRLRDRAKSLMSFSKEPCPGWAVTYRLLLYVIIIIITYIQKIRELIQYHCHLMPYIYLTNTYKVYNYTKYILMINFSTYMSLEVPEFSPSFSHHRPPPMQYTLLWLLPGT